MSKQLSVKESEVFNYVVEGYSNKEISVRMSITEKSVKFHTTNIFKKTEVNSRYKLISSYYQDKIKQLAVTNQLLKLSQ